MRTEDDFLEWLNQADIYIGWDRYAQFEHWGFVCATSYNENDQLREDIESIGCAGDIEAMEAGSRIKADSDCWCASHKNPAIAMTELVEKLRRYYFDELNKLE